MRDWTKYLKSRRLAALLVTGYCSLSIFSAAQPAGAAFPGVNGSIVFTSDRDTDGDYELYTVTSIGGSPTKLTDNAVTDNQPAYSAAGTKIVFRRTTGGDDGEIYSMNADGSGSSRLTNNSVPDREPSWSPDGAMIAFARGSTGDIYVMNADGSGVTRLTNTAALDEREPVWSPDGQWIAYSRQQTDGSYDVFKFTSAGSNRVALTSCGANTYCVSPDWSPSGTQIAYARWPASGASIWTMNADGSNKVQITPNEQATNSYPSWSPDGTAIAYTKFNGAFVGDLYRRDVSGGNVLQLTTSGADDWNSDWQPA